MLLHAFALISLLAAAVPAVATAEPDPKPKLCRIHHADLLLQHHERQDEWLDLDHTECNPVGQEYLFYELRFSQERNLAALSGLFLQYEPSWLENGIITVPATQDPILLTSDQVLQGLTKKEQNNRSLQQFRSLQRAVTEENEGVMIVARVSTPDESPNNSIQTINQYIFLDGETSFRDVHADCSLMNKVIRPYLEDTPVLEFSLDTNIDEFTFGSFYAAVEPLIEESLGVNSVHDVAEFVLLVAPNGLRPSSQQPNFRFVAAGAYNSWKTVVTDDWVDTPQVLQHEIGHNYNLGHPWESGRLYGDSSSVMGQVFRGVVYNCYNGVHYDYLGWMKNRTLEYEITDNDPVQEVELAFYGHYEREDSVGLPLLLVVNNHYIYYNRATGINRDTNEYPDSVLLHRWQEEGVIQSGTDLVAVVDDSADTSSYRNFAFNIAIDFCSRKGGDGADVSDTVTLAIGPANADLLCELYTDEPSDMPSGFPTISPKPTVSPAPSNMPTVLASGSPSVGPTMTSMPTFSVMPSLAPSVSFMPTITPKPSASLMPSGMPSISPAPSNSAMPSGQPSVSDAPSGMPTVSPTGMMMAPNMTMAPIEVPEGAFWSVYNISVAPADDSCLVTEGDMVPDSCCLGDGVELTPHDALSGGNSCFVLGPGLVPFSGCVSNATYGYGENCVGEGAPFMAADAEECGCSFVIEGSGCYKANDIPGQQWFVYLDGDSCTEAPPMPMAPTMAPNVTMAPNMTDAPSMSPPVMSNSSMESPPGMVIVRSLNSFDETYSNLIATLNDNVNINIVKEVNHTEMAASVGRELSLNSLVVFANPNLGTPIMEANIAAGIDLPQKMLVWETEAGEVFVGYNAADYIRERFSVDVSQLDTIAGALANLASVATGVMADDIGLADEFSVADVGLSTSTSDADFETTFSRLIAAIEASPADVSFVVDHGLNSAGALPPTRLVVFGNPNLGTPLMVASPTAGIDLPLKIIIWTDNDDDGSVKVTTNDVDYLGSRHAIEDALLPSISAAITNFVNAATNASTES